MHLDHQLIHVLFTEASSEMVMKGGCQEPPLGAGGRGMPNDTRIGLKISGDRSYGGMNPPQSPDPNMTEAVWDHLDRERD